MLDASTKHSTLPVEKPLATLTLSGGTGTFEQYGKLVNNGTLAVTSGGSLIIAGGGTGDTMDNNGTLTISDGSTATFQGSLYGSNTAFSEGTIHNEGNVNLNADNELQITGTGYLYNSGYFDVDGGSLTLAGTGPSGTIMDNSGTFETHNSGSTTLGGVEDTSYVNNTGYIATYGGGTFTLAGNASLLNQNSYTYGDDYTGNGTLIIEESATFNNAGSLNLADDGILTNAGTLQLYENSTLMLYSGAQVTNTNYIGSSGATITINGGASIDNEGTMCLYDATTLALTVGEYDDADAVLDNSGWLGIYDSSTLTATGNADNDITAQINNTGNLDIYDGGTLTVEASGDLTTSEGGTTTIGDEWTAGTVTVNAGGTLQVGDDATLNNWGTITANGGSTTEVLNGGTLTNQSGATIHLVGDATDDVLVIARSGGAIENDGTIEVDTNSIFVISEDDGSNGNATCINAGAINVDSDGEFDNAGDFSNDDGTIVNAGKVILLNDNLGPIDAINNSGSNTGTVAFDADVDLTDLTVTGGTFEIWRTATNDEGFTIGTSTTVINKGSLVWNDSDWTQFNKIDNSQGELISGDAHERHWADSSYTTGFTSAFSATGSLYNSAANPFTPQISLDGDGGSSISGTWTAASNNLFTITYDPDAHTVTYTTAGITSLVKHGVSWSGTGDDVLFLSAQTTGDNFASTGVKFSGLTLTPTGGSAITLGDTAKAGFISAGVSDTLGITGVTLHNGFTLTGYILPNCNSSSPEGAFTLAMAGGTFVLASPTVQHWITPRDQPMDKTLVFSGSVTTKEVNVDVYDSPGGAHNATDALVVDTATVPTGLGVSFTINGDGSRTVTVSKTGSPAIGWCEIKIYVDGSPGAYARIRVWVK